LMSKRLWAYLIGAALGLWSQVHWLQGHGWDNSAYVRLAAGPLAGWGLAWLAVRFVAPLYLFQRIAHNWPAKALNLLLLAAVANYLLSIYPGRVELGGGWVFGGRLYGWPALWLAAALWAQHVALTFGWAYRQHLYGISACAWLAEKARLLRSKLEARLPDWLSAALRDILLFWVLPRAALLFIANLASHYFLARMNLGSGIPRLSDSVFSFLMRFDAWYYNDIARHLYQNKDDLFAFFPLYPLLTRGLSELTAWPVYVSGILIANLAVIFALVLLYKAYFPKLGRQPLCLAVLLLSIWPSSIFFSSFYSESLYLLLLVWSFDFFRRGNLALSGVTGALLTATRPTGLVLLPAFALGELVDKRRLNWRMLWLLLICAGVIGYSLFCWSQTGDPLFFSAIQHKWGRALTWPVTVFSNHFGSMVHNNHLANEVDFAFMLDMLSALLAIALIPYIWKRIGAAEALLVLGTLLLSFSTGSTRSLARFTLTMFPLFLALGDMLQGRWRAVMVLVLGLMTVSVFTAVEFAAWLWTW
jgi:Gpi18-like mannosyltransferase